MGEFVVGACKFTIILESISVAVTRKYFVIEPANFQFDVYTNNQKLVCARLVSIVWKAA